MNKLEKCFFRIFFLVFLHIAIRQSVMLSIINSLLVMMMNFCTVTTELNNWIIQFCPKRESDVGCAALGGVRGFSSSCFFQFFVEEGERRESFWLTILTLFFLLFWTFLLYCKPSKPWDIKWKRVTPSEEVRWQENLNFLSRLFALSYDNSGALRASLFLQLFSRCV